MTSLINSITAENNHWHIMPLRQILKPTISCQRSSNPVFKFLWRDNCRDQHAKSVWGVNRNPCGDSWCRRACCGRKNLGPGIPHWLGSCFLSPTGLAWPSCASQASGTVRASSGYSTNTCWIKIHSVRELASLIQSFQYSLPNTQT